MKAVWTLIVIFLAVSISSCSEKTPALVHLSGNTMGTQYNVKYVPPTSLSPEVLQQEIDSVLLHVNKLMSTYDPNSELSLFNKTESTEHYSLSSETLLVMQEAFRIGHLSGGVLDVTLDPIISLWGFGDQGRPNRVPSEDQIKEAQAKSGIDKVLLDETGATKLNPDLSINLSTIAKGYGVDVVGELLLAKGIENFLVEIGGETLAHGKKNNDVAWRIAIEKPVSNERAVQRILSIENKALATSGDYRIYFEENGVRYSHLINPKTGKPISHNLVSVSVISDTCMTADGLATALNVMGHEKGLFLANNEGIAALFMIKEGNEYKEVASEAFKAYLN